MLKSNLRKRLRAELESPREIRLFDTGWLSGVAALVAAIAGLFFVLCLRYPAELTVPQMREMYDHPVFRIGLHLLLIAAFALGCVSLVLRANKILGLLAIGSVLLATVLGGSTVSAQGELTSGAFLGLDWFVLNVVFTGFLFIPLERLFARHAGRPLFRSEWREDLFYYLVSSVHSTFVHANLGWNFDRLGEFLVTPRFHRWHHGIEKEAIDVNFAIHFPLLDRIFGTYHLPKGQWPRGYGIGGHPVPTSYWRQFFYPFVRKRK